MNNDVEQRIRERAHKIWEQEGRPLGRDRAHWDRASREIAEETEDHAPERDDASEEGNVTAPAPTDWQESEATRENPELSGLTRGGDPTPNRSE